MVMCVCLRRFYFSMNVGWDVCLFCVGPGCDELLLGLLFWSDVRPVVWCL